jgi:hypothetical protein
MSDEHLAGSGTGPTATETANSADTQPLVSAARLEQPNPQLADRLLSELSYRRRLFDATPESRAIKGKRTWLSGSMVAALGVLAAAAATVLLVHPSFRRPAVLASAEPPRSVAPVGIAPSAARATARDPCQGRLVAAGRQPLIDDFEDGDDAISPFEGRMGLWRWVRDTDRPGTAPALLPIPQTRPQVHDRQALHVKGARLLDWGASIEFTFQPACYDATAYRGISLRAKGPGRIYVAAREVRLIPSEGGGTCQGSDCYNVHVKKFDLSARYVTYEARWFELQQRGYGRPPVDPGQLHSIAIFVRPEDTPYDLWVDDVRFID